jgi:PDZ domain-containing protein
LIASCFISVPYEAIVPGSTLNTNSLVSVPAPDRQHSSGSVSLVDVDLVSLRAISYLVDSLNHNDDVLKTTELIGTESQAAYNEQGVLDMATAQEAATYVALSRLGYPVQAKANGVVVYATLPSSPAVDASSGAALAPGDVLTSIAGTKVLSFQSLSEMVTQRHPGDQLRLTVKLYGTKSTHETTIKLGELVTNKAGDQRCEVVQTPNPQNAKNSACIGIKLYQLYKTTNQPFKINLSAEGIIGPSAGLSFTLGLMKALDTASLTGGLKIAATGTMSINGDIGDVGGVAQKTIAVKDSGASVFFVPKVEYKVAKSKAGSKLRIFAVTTISQVLSDLKSLGGRIVTESRR